MDEVCTWLDSIGLKQYEEAFRNNAIDGAELFNLTLEMLVDDLKIGKLGSDYMGQGQTQTGMKVTCFGPVTDPKLGQSEFIFRQVSCKGN